MIHPSYVELMEVVNEDVVIGEEPVVNSRYSIVLAAAKRARELIDGADTMVAHPKPITLPSRSVRFISFKILLSPRLWLTFLISIIFSIHLLYPFFQG